MYRPRKGADDTAEEDINKIVKTNKFRPDKEFEGVDRSKATEVCSIIMSIFCPVVGRNERQD